MPNSTNTIQITADDKFTPEELEEIAVPLLAVKDAYFDAVSQGINMDIKQLIWQALTACTEVNLNVSTFDTSVALLSFAYKYLNHILDDEDLVKSLAATGHYFDTQDFIASRFLDAATCVAGFFGGIVTDSIMCNLLTYQPDHQKKVLEESSIFLEYSALMSYLNTLRSCREQTPINSASGVFVAASAAAVHNVLTSTLNPDATRN